MVEGLHNQKEIAINEMVGTTSVKEGSDCR
jgi:hypothetical protein